MSHNPRCIVVYAHSDEECATSAYSCGNCNTAFPTVTDLNIHVERFHPAPLRPRRGKRRVEPQDIGAAQSLLGIATRQEVRFIDRGRAYDPASRKMYKDGFAPWQLFVTTCRHQYVVMHAVDTVRCRDCEEYVRPSDARDGTWVLV